MRKFLLSFLIFVLALFSFFSINFSFTKCSFAVSVPDIDFTMPKNFDNVNSSSKFTFSSDVTSNSLITFSPFKKSVVDNYTYNIYYQFYLKDTSQDKGTYIENLDYLGKTYYTMFKIDGLGQRGDTFLDYFNENSFPLSSDLPFVNVLDLYDLFSFSTISFNSSTGISTNNVYFCSNTFLVARLDGYYFLLIDNSQRIVVFENIPCYSNINNSGYFGMGGIVQLPVSSSSHSGIWNICLSNPQFNYVQNVRYVLNDFSNSYSVPFASIYLLGFNSSRQNSNLSSFSPSQINALIQHYTYGGGMPITYNLSSFKAGVIFSHSHADTALFEKVDISVGSNSGGYYSFLNFTMEQNFSGSYPNGIPMSNYGETDIYFMPSNFLYLAFNGNLVETSDGSSAWGNVDFNSFYRQPSGVFDVFTSIYNLFIYLVFDAPIISSIVRFIYVIFNFLVQFIQTVISFVSSLGMLGELLLAIFFISFIFKIFNKN